MASKDYSGLKKAELIGMAKRKKAPVMASMNKDEIIKAIKKIDRAKAKAKAKPVSKAKAKAKPAKQTTAKAKTTGKSGVAVKKRKPVASKSTAPTAPSKKKAASGKKSTGKPARKVSHATVVRESAPKPEDKSEERSDWSIRMAARKFFTARERDDFPPEKEAAQLPDSYGENRLVALPKDPRSLFLYWEVQEAKAEEARQSLGKGWEQVKWTLRIFDVTSLRGVEEAYHNFFDVTVDFEAGKHYLSVDGDGREYIVELGLKDADKRFSSICFSNRVHTSRTGASPGGEELSDEKALQLYALSGGHHPGSMFIEEMASMGVSSFGASEQSPAIHAKRDYFLWANCELTVYGGTEPGSRLTLQGQEINVRPDGTFSVQFHLPDGVQDIQVSGTSADGLDNKEILLSVSRSSRIVR